MRRALALGTFTALVFVFFVGANDFKIFPRTDPNAPKQSIATPGDEPVTLLIAVKPATEREFQLLRRRSSPTGYYAEVVLLDDSGRKSFGVVSTIVEPGKRETATGKIRGGDVVFSVALDRQATRALAEATVTKNGAIVQKQKSDVMLRTSIPDRVLPAQ